ncbi:pyocin knob domain-containing protein [Microcoleus sp. B4-C1]|uniref:pyocin knob domain-containing protein n=1 Tax=Microcoleus sp. B4-C1 TaxID=2818660 RepID=UPI002FD7893D
MDTITKTFSTSLNDTYTANSIIELSHFRDMTFDNDERVGIYLEAWMCNLNLKSFLPGVIPEFDGEESEAEKMAKFTACENKSEKLGLRILGRKNNTGDWQEKAEIILVNRGRKDYFDLLQPYLAKNAVRILEKNDALGIQLIDYGNGLLKENDSIGIELGITITIAKKNNMDIFNARLAALELALENRLINVPANTLLGRDETTGTIQTISQSRFATPQQIDQAIIDLVGGAPGALNTLIELASALNNDANFAATIANQLTLKAPLNNPIFTGDIKARNAWLLETRSGSTILNANTLTFNQYAGTMWIDGAVINSNLPNNSGMIMQFDSLFGTGAANLYKVQEFTDGNGNFWKRCQNNGTWGNWQKIAFI